MGKDVGSFALPALTDLGPGRKGAGAARPSTAPAATCQQAKPSTGKCLSFKFSSLRNTAPTPTPHGSFSFKAPGLETQHPHTAQPHVWAMPM